MIVWILQHLKEVSVLLPLWTFALSAASLAFSAYRFIHTRMLEKKREQFNMYHAILKAISSGSDKDGGLKLVSQRAFIYELRQFKEYAPLSVRLLESLEQQWRQGESPEKFAILKLEIDETKGCLTRR